MGIFVCKVGSTTQIRAMKEVGGQSTQKNLGEGSKFLNEKNMEFLFVDVNKFNII